jgi:hypothetical protein
MGRGWAVFANDWRNVFWLNRYSFRKGHIWSKSFSLPSSFWNLRVVIVFVSKTAANRLMVSSCLWDGRCHVRVEESKIMPSTVPFVERPNAFSNFG